MGLFTHKTKGNIENKFPSENLFIKQITLNGSRDFALLQHNLLDGNLMIVNLKPLLRIAKGQKSESSVLQDQLQKIKKYCLRTGGNVIKLKECTLLITPNHLFKIER
ncbi:MAG: hypothetical protein K9W44_05110 [Candidatus Lokiarchaeota archaeon]|nr:hypothetical protein [Candidatus Harpocratesius repetitus]